MFNFSFVFGAYYCCCGYCSNVSWIDQSDSFDSHYEGIDANLLTFKEKVILLFILNTFLFMEKFIKRNSDSEGTFFLKAMPLFTWLIKVKESMQLCIIRPIKSLKLLGIRFLLFFRFIDLPVNLEITPNVLNAV